MLIQKFQILTALVKNIGFFLLFLYEFCGISTNLTYVRQNLNEKIMVPNIGIGLMY